MLAGRCRRPRALTIQDVWEAVGAHERGRLPRAELDTIEPRGLPGRRLLHGNFTANTMAIARRPASASSVIGDGLIPAAQVGGEGRRGGPRRRAGGRAGGRGERSIPVPFFWTAARSRTRWPATVASGGWTAASCTCWRSRARPACRSRSTSSPRSARGTPVLADLVPGGRFVASDLHRAGGTATLIRELIRRGHVDGAAPTVDGRTLAEATAQAPEPDGEVIRPLEKRIKPPRGSLHALRGNLAPEGCVLKLAGTERRAHTGPARVFDDEASCTDALRAGEIAEGRGARRPLRGASGRPGDARDARPHLVGGRRRAGGVGRARDRRALLGRRARADGRPRRARGGAGRADRGGARRRRP